MQEQTPNHIHGKGGDKYVSDDMADPRRGVFFPIQPHARNLEGFLIIRQPCVMPTPIARRLPAIATSKAVNCSSVMLLPTFAPTLLGQAAPGARES